jgi:hypothetical protein
VLQEDSRLHFLQVQEMRAHQGCTGKREDHQTVVIAETPARRRDKKTSESDGLDPHHSQDGKLLELLHQREQ